jgi:hypothetical protein
LILVESCRPLWSAGWFDRDGDEETAYPEQVVRELTQSDRLLAEGKDVADVRRQLQVSEQT